jgi:Family of unknown function (DUF6176)
MPEAQCIKYSIKPDKRESLVNWIARLKDRPAEMAEALAEGGLVAEAVFLEKSDSGEQILIYTSAEDLPAGMEALSKSTLPLVQEFNRLLAESVDVEHAVSLKLIFHAP